MADVHVGIVGFGLAGAVFHAPLIEAVDGLEVTGIVTGDAGRQTQARAAYPHAAVVPSLDALWGEIDVLVVAAPNRAHVPLALEGIEHGLAVVVDKPLASSVAEAQELLEAGGALTVFQNRRWDGDFLTVRRLVEAGGLGGGGGFESRLERFPPRGAAGRRRGAPPPPGGRGGRVRPPAAP